MGAVIMKRILIVFAITVLAILIYYSVVVLEARSGTPSIVQNALGSERMKLELNDLTDDQLQALLKIQDPDFYNHNGIDMSTPGAGVTTISQGLVKMYYFQNFKPGVQKIKQSLIARFAFDALTPKDTILKLFINEVYLGHHNGKEVKGFENAANVYLNKPFSKLSWDEYLGLVAMIRSPNNLHYIRNKTVNLERVARIKKVLAGEYIPRNNGDWLYGQDVKL